jgi:hypothetical protein
MIFGAAIQPLMMLVPGVTLLVLIVLQMLLGMRKINLGKKTRVWHKWTAWAIVCLAALHGVVGFLFVTGYSLF